MTRIILYLIAKPPLSLQRMSFSSSDDEGASAASKKKAPRMSIERIYQKKSQLEHILLRPDTYIGSVESYNQVFLLSQ